MRLYKYEGRIHYAAGSWLPAIRQEQMNPEYESFGETVDSLFYGFRENGTTAVKWQQRQNSSGTGGSTSLCSPLPRFFQF